MTTRLSIHAAILAIFAVAALAASQTSKPYVLRYETCQYGKDGDTISWRVVTESIDSTRLNVSMFEYRLDQKPVAGAPIDSSAIGRGSLNLLEISPDSLAAYRAALLASPTAKALLDHRLEFMGHIDTIAGLPSYQFAIVSEGVRQYLVWLAAAPAGLENLQLLQSLEYPRRNASFIVEEEVFNMLRLVLLRGVDFPPGVTGGREPFIVTRYDTAVNIDFFFYRNNTYLYELKSLTAGAAPTK